MKTENVGNPLPYNSLGSAVAKFRRTAAVRKLSREERQAYGAAVEDAVKKAQIRALRGPDKDPFARIVISLTPISRLLRYENPIRMAGDPAWSTDGDAWLNREKAVYAEALKNKTA